MTLWTLHAPEVWVVLAGLALSLGLTGWRIFGRPQKGTKSAGVENGAN
jgi:hypothetical protein